MPELSRFYGIVIRMYFGDHDPAHFHAEYAGDRAVISIETLAVMGGRLPPRALLGDRVGSAASGRAPAGVGKAKNLEPAGRIDPLP
jgi:hypothetical protein